MQRFKKITILYNCYFLLLQCVFTRIQRQAKRHSKDTGKHRQFFKVLLGMEK
ncbi:MAG: hypothetical protein ACI9XO_002704 [Paraglaciecola sp.]|jgi:hypothetical protein